MKRASQLFVLFLFFETNSSANAKLKLGLIVRTCIPTGSYKRRQFLRRVRVRARVSSSMEEVSSQYAK